MPSWAVRLASISSGCVSCSVSTAPPGAAASLASSRSPATVFAPLSDSRREGTMTSEIFGAGSKSQQTVSTPSARTAACGAGAALAPEPRSTATSCTCWTTGMSRRSSKSLWARLSGSRSPLVSRWWWKLRRELVEVRRRSRPLGRRERGPAWGGVRRAQGGARQGGRRAVSAQRKVAVGAAWSRDRLGLERRASHFPGRT
mmetsp:Transcript_72330/g.192818  ORF Transcript_72330/g.192818 Transcript_72330/m.192818 type:complete len:201 (-) Transcript_72330:3-605(-)